MRVTTATTETPAKPEWFASWFDSAHYHRLYAHRDQAEAGAFIDRLIGRLDPKSGAAMLDLGCGSGRHARSLAARGFDVTGIDLSAGSLARARQFSTPSVRFVEQDMREPFGDHAFDFVFSLFTSFGYFEDRGEHLTVVQNIARSLRDRGSVVLDYLNVHHAEQHYQAHEAIERDGVRYELSRWSDAEAIFKRIVINDRSLVTPLEYVERVAKLTLSDFRALFAACGLAIEGVFGDYELADFNEGSSPRLIVVATRHTAKRDWSAPREVLADSAERLGRHAQVRSEHRLGHALHDRRVGLEKFEVALFGGRAERADDPLVLGRGVTLKADPKGRGIGGNVLDEVLLTRRIDQEQFGVLDGFDEIRRRRALAEADRVGNPPRLGAELDDVFLAPDVDHEVAQATDRHESGVAADLAGALQKLPGGEPSVNKRLPNRLEVVFAERGPGIQIRAQDGECGRIN
jgi:SAM-dependent methyltransferase